MKLKLVLFAFAFIIILVLNQKVSAQTDTTNYKLEEQYGVISKIVAEGEELSGDISSKYQVVEVKLESGQTITPQTVNFYSKDARLFKVGDQVIINKLTDPSMLVTYNVVDYLRINPLIILVVVFVLTILFIAKKQGLYSIISLLVSFFIIFKLMIPLLFNNVNPILVTFLVALIIVPFSYILTHGLNKKTYVAIVGTITTLLISSILAHVFIQAIKLSGFSTEEASFLFQAENSIGIRALLLSSIIVSFLGILDDITISQSAVAFELFEVAKGKLSFNELFERTSNVGKDHIASLVNTLILVYAGSALPLMMLISQSDRSIFRIINDEYIAEEIARMVISSLGLILAVPITTFIGAYYLTKFKRSQRN